MAAPPDPLPRARPTSPPAGVADAHLPSLLLTLVQAPYFVGICDSQQRPVFINPAGRRMAGLPPEAEVSQLTVADFFHAEDRPLLTEVGLPTVIRDGCWEGELRLRRLDGGPDTPVRWRGFALRDDQGGLLGVAGFSFDITDRRRAEARLRESEARFRQLSDHAPVFIWRTDPDGVVQQLNGRWYDFSGHRPEEGAAAASFEDIHPDDRGRARELWARSLERGETFEHEYRCRGADGGYRWLLGRIEPFRDEAGRITGWFGGATDIHDRKMAEKALRNSNALFRSFADNSNNLLWVYDPGENQVDYVNPAFERVWGEPPEAVLGRRGRWSDTIHPDDRERVDAWLRALETGESPAIEYRIVRADGAVRWLRDTGFPIHGSGGTLRRLGGIAQDVTANDGNVVYLVGREGQDRDAVVELLRRSGRQVTPFATAREFLDVAPVLVGGCVLISDPQTESRGIGLLRELKAKRVALPVIVTAEGDGHIGYAVRAMKAGAADVLEAPWTPEALLAAVSGALAELRQADGEHQWDAAAAARVNSLTPREREVLERLLAGGTNKTIGRDLGLSPRTVESHRARVMERLGAETLPEAVLTAAAAGLRPPPRSGGAAKLSVLPD